MPGCQRVQGDNPLQGPSSGGLQASVVDVSLEFSRNSNHFAHPHLLGVISDLFATIKADDVGLPFTYVCGTDECDRSGKAAMPAPEK